ncbi:MAG: NAD(P)-dependent oxidoreductase [Aquificaceae bacterium]
MRIGFIGLGNLGKEIAKRLISQGVELLVWNRTKEKAVELGVPLAQCPAELVSQVDRVFIIVFDSQASEEIIFGKDGLVHGAIEGKTIVDMTTNHYAYVESAGMELKKYGAFYLDAPLLGSIVPAKRGELTMLVSGNKERFEETLTLFEKFCKSVYYVGEIGGATKLKLINNTVLGGFMAVLAEAIAMGENAGFDKELLIRVLSDGAGKSYLLDAKKEKLLKEDFSTHFSVDLIYKDLHYAQDLIKDLRAFSFLLQNVKEAYGKTRSMGLGGFDFSAVYNAYRHERVGGC